MAFGPKHCAACGSGIGVQEHHLVPVVHGGAELPTVWLCFSCHGLVHGVSRSPRLHELIAAGLAAAKARGVKLGNPQLAAGSRAAAACANAVKIERALCRAQAVRPEIDRVVADGAVSLRQIAAALEARGVRAPGGSARWNPNAVKRVLEMAANVEQRLTALAARKAAREAVVSQATGLARAIDLAVASGCIGAKQVAAFLQSMDTPGLPPGRKWTETRLKRTFEYRHRVVSVPQTVD